MLLNIFGTQLFDVWASLFNLSSKAQQAKLVWSTRPVNVLLNYFATQLFDGLASSPIRYLIFLSSSYLMNYLVRQSINQSVIQSVDD